LNELTPGERLLYSLGQMYQHWRAGVTGALPPHLIDIQAVARTRWVCTWVEYVQEGERDEQGIIYAHLPGEVLVIDFKREFPWRLLGLEEWGERQEMREHLRRAA